MGWASRLTPDAKYADKLARLRRFTAHKSDDQLLSAATDPMAVAMVHALRPHLKPEPEVTITRLPDGD